MFKQEAIHTGLDLLFPQRALAVVDNVLGEAAPLEMKNRGLKMDDRLINSRKRDKKCKGLSLSLSNNCTQAVCSNRPSLSAH